MNTETTDEKDELVARLATESVNLHTHPQPERKPMTDEQIIAAVPNGSCIAPAVLQIARAIERAHGIGEMT